MEEKSLNLFAEYRNGQSEHYNIYGNRLIGKLVQTAKAVTISQTVSGQTITAKDTVYIVAGGRINSESMVAAVGNSSTSDKRYYYLSDHLGSIRVVLNESGGVDSWSDYYPFGKESRGSSTSNEPKEQFTGYEHDTEISLEYANHRFYNSDLGRFTTVDNYSFKYPSFTPYNYTQNNPVVFADYSGDTVIFNNEKIRMSHEFYYNQVDDDGNYINKYYRDQYDKLNSSEIFYYVDAGKTTNSDKAQTTTKDGQSISITLDLDKTTDIVGTLSHEFAHGVQFENGKIAFNLVKLKEGGTTWTSQAYHGIDEELGAYNAAANAGKPAIPNWKSMSDQNKRNLVKSAYPELEDGPAKDIAPGSQREIIRTKKFFGIQPKQ